MDPADAGLVVVGDLIGYGSAREQAIVGETPNLAARLQACAEPNTIIIAEGTRRQIGALFEVADLGPSPEEDAHEVAAVAAVEPTQREAMERPFSARDEGLAGGREAPFRVKTRTEYVLPSPLAQKVKAFFAERLAGSNIDRPGLQRTPAQRGWGRSAGRAAWA